MATIYKGTVLVEAASIRTGPGLNYSLYENRTLHKGEIFFITDTRNENGNIWGKMDNGWVRLLTKRQRFVDYQPYQMPTRAPFAIQPRDVPGAETVDNTSTTDTFEAATNETFQGVFQTIFMDSSSADVLLKKSMRLFGLPFQFRDTVDTRVSNVSKEIGRKYMENIIMEAPVVTIIPGKPVYLPGTGNKDGWTHAFINAASGNFSALQQLTSDENDTVRYYDFQQSYTEFMTYVNIMCRTAATFLELTEEIDGIPLQSYDWRNWRWNGDNYQAVAAKMLRTAANASSNVVNGIVEKVATYGAQALDAVQNVFSSSTSGSSNEFKYTTTGSGEEQQAADEIADSILQTCNFMQFYVDPDMANTESASNSTTESSIKGMFDSGSSALKELAFVANSGGVDKIEDLQNFSEASLQALADKITGGGNISTFLNRILNVGSNIVKGENVIMPEIYNSSNYDRRYQLTVHLKAPYGNRLTYFMEVLVPLFHLLALTLPKQTSANTYGSPFLVKAYCEGVFSCNLGIVSDISISKNVSPESWTVDGFPSEVDVSLTITDLYSDLSMSPQSSPLMFLNNSSLIEYLATSCGLNLIQPQLNTRLNYTIQTIKNAFGDIDQNVLAQAADEVERLIRPWISISTTW